MCFSQGMSATLAFLCFAVAACEHQRVRSIRYTMGLAYFGLMELLQAVQYSWLAEPEDGYAMCKNPVNQVLTVLGGVHVAFQPFFIDMMLTSFWRMNNIVDRIESDLIKKMSLFYAVWLISAYFRAIIWPDDPNRRPPYTEACPNYGEWMVEGFDYFINATTPNIPGHSCTYRPPTETGHLAWALPLFNPTYMNPASSMHFFIFFAPYLLSRRPIVMRIALIGVLAGPVLAMKLTQSSNEAAAIWCFSSVLQVVFYAICSRMRGYHKEPAPVELLHEGEFGEKPLKYFLDDTTKGGNTLAEDPEHEKKFWFTGYYDIKFQTHQKVKKI